MKENIDRVTPGPWKITLDHEDFLYQQVIEPADGNGRIIAVVDKGDEQDLSNGRAFVRIPELLDVLRLAVENAEYEDRARRCGFSSYYHQARALLREIEGEG